MILNECFIRDTVFFQASRWADAARSHFNWLWLIVIFSQSCGDGDGNDGDGEYWCWWKWVPPGPSTLPLLSLPSGSGDYSFSVGGSNLPCLIFLHLILPRMFCFVFSRPILFHTLPFQPLLTSSALSSFILLPRQNVRLLHLPHCAPPRVLPLCRAPLSPHACLASSHEDQLLWLYRWSAQVRHVSEPVPWQTVVGSNINWFNFAALLFFNCFRLNSGRLRRSFIIWW